MIDLTTETVLSLTQATKLLPQRRKGKRPHVATLYRWASRGLRGVKLETIQIGGTLCTSVPALQRFFEALSVQPHEEGCASSRTRQQQIQRAAAELLQRGI